MKKVNKSFSITIGLFLVFTNSFSQIVNSSYSFNKADSLMVANWVYANNYEKAFSTLRQVEVKSIKNYNHSLELELFFQKKWPLAYRVNIVIKTAGKKYLLFGNGIGNYFETFGIQHFIRTGISKKKHSIEAGVGYVSLLRLNGSPSSKAARDAFFEIHPIGSVPYFARYESIINLNYGYSYRIRQLSLGIDGHIWWGYYRYYKKRIAMPWTIKLIYHLN